MKFFFSRKMSITEEKTVQKPDYTTKEGMLAWRRGMQFLMDCAPTNDALSPEVVELGKMNHFSQMVENHFNLLPHKERELFMKEVDGYDENGKKTVFMNGLHGLRVVLVPFYDPSHGKYSVKLKSISPTNFEALVERKRSEKKEWSWSEI